HRRAQDRLERQMLVEQQREPEAEPELDHAGDERIEERIEQRQTSDLISPQELVIFQADPSAATSDLGVGEAEIGTQSERIGQEKQQQRRRGQHEQEPEDGAIVERPGERGLMIRDGGNPKTKQRSIGPNDLRRPAVFGPKSST